MADAGTVVADGVRVTIYCQTGVVTGARKQRETPADSITQRRGNRAVTFHHELFVVDSTGRESAFDLVDLDVPVRDGDTVSVVWLMPESAESESYVQIHNHSTGDDTLIDPKRLLPRFFKKGLMWGATIGGTIVGFLIFWPLGFAGMIGPYLYFKSRAMKAIKGIFDSVEYRELRAQLAQIEPTAAAAA